MQPSTHVQRMERARIALDGLSVGDAFGERFFVSPAVVDGLIAARAVPRAPWGTTDDTEMATAIVDVLARRAGVDRDLLAAAFARRYAHDCHRGYGGGAHGLLGALCAGAAWEPTAGAMFDGQGSMGNGGAMRAAPIGAYFADDLDALVAHARASAEVTHAHAEGQAGAVLVALAAAYAWRARHAPDALAGHGSLLAFVLAHAPDGATRAGLARAAALPPDASVALAASVLGNGSRVLAEDTVPLALWAAARHLGDFEAALWTTVAALGDRDTTCAIVGGIVVLNTGRGAIPDAWLAAREALRFDDALPA